MEEWKAELLETMWFESVMAWMLDVHCSAPLVKLDRMQIADAPNRYEYKPILA